MWNRRKSQISAIFEKVDFWRFWASGTTRNSGDVQFLVAKSCLTQDFRPGCQVWAQSLNCIHIFETPQKCDFRGSRQVCVKNGQNSGGRSGPHEWLKTTQIIVLWLKTVKKLVWDIFRHDLMGFRAEKNFDFFSDFQGPSTGFWLNVEIFKFDRPSPKMSETAPNLSDDVFRTYRP